MTVVTVPGWHAVLRGEDAVCGEIVPVRLLGREMAIWRTAGGDVRAWDDRCPHRGTRLTLGTHDGDEIVCRYHGWRFDGASARCTFVPAHPAQTPPRSAVVPTYHCVERYGLVWVAPAGADDAGPRVPDLDGRSHFTLRSVTFDAPHAAVGRALADDAATDRAIPPVYLLQPHGAGRTTVHGVVVSEATGPERLALLRAHHERMKALLRRMTSGAVAAEAT